MRGKANFGNKTSALLGQTDDIVAHSKQAREDVLTTMLEAGLMPHTKHIAMESEDDVETMYRQVAAEGDTTLVVYRIPRDVAESGWIGGAVGAATIAGMPENAHGRVMLCFDGWANDRRELFEIPCVVEWCRGLLFVSMEQPWQENAKRVLSIMFDEDAAAFENGVLMHPRVLEAAGGLWVCSTAFADSVYSRDPRSPSGWSRDYGLSFHIREWLLGRVPSPPG